MALDAVMILRRNVDEVDKDSLYNDDELSERLKAAASPAAAARDVWIEKMAAAASLVNISEGGSTRSMQQAYSNAQDMVAFWSKAADNAATVSPTGTVLRAVTRA